MSRCSILQVKVQVEVRFWVSVDSSMLADVSVCRWKQGATNRKWSSGCCPARCCWTQTRWTGPAGPGPPGWAWSSPPPYPGPGPGPGPSLGFGSVRSRTRLWRLSHPARTGSSPSHRWRGEPESCEDAVCAGKPWRTKRKCSSQARGSDLRALSWAFLPQLTSESLQNLFYLLFPHTSVMKSSHFCSIIISTNMIFTMY